MTPKEITVTFYRTNHLRPDWQVDADASGFRHFFIDLASELAPFGITVTRAHNHDHTIDVKSYADLLNSVRVTSLSDGFNSRCVGHIIGKSERLDLLDDIRRAVNRIAFAPETIPPDDQNRKVCHNCGCGC
ncbi:MAG TPA: hypothetical protein VFR01_03620 [Geobacterales bacterium]|nr:hypothetical protein [Geobacterales bacterium]